MLDDKTVPCVRTFQENKLGSNFEGLAPDGHDVSCPYNCREGGVLGL